MGFFNADKTEGSAVTEGANLLSNVWGVLLETLQELWAKFISTIPGIVSAVVVIALGYLIGSAFGLLFTKFLEAIKADTHLKKAGLAHSIGFINVAHLGGGLLKWYIFATFLSQAAELVSLGPLSLSLKNFANWLPNLFIAVIIILAGLIFADMVADRMLHAKRRGVRMVSTGVRWLMILFVVLVALGQVFSPTVTDEGLTQDQKDALRQLRITEDDITALNQIGVSDEQIAAIGQAVILKELEVTDEQIAGLEQKRLGKEFLGMNPIAAIIIFIIGMLGLGIAVAFGIGFSLALKEESKSLIEEFKKNW